MINGKITLILIDLNLPKTCSMDVIKFLKRETAYSRIPEVVMSTGYGINSIYEA